MTIERKVLTGLIACAIIFIGLAIFILKNSDKFIASTNLVDHSNKVVNEFEQVLVTSMDIETGSRGFIITGEDKYLEPFTNAGNKLSEHLEKVKKLTKDNPEQQTNIAELEKELKNRFSELKYGIDARRKDFETAREFILSGTGKATQDSIRKIIDNALDIENKLLTERKQNSDNDAGFFNKVFIILLAMVFIVLVVVFNLVFVNLKTLKRSETKTSDKNWLLTGYTELNGKLKGDQTIEELANNTISFLCTYLKANIGAVYQFSTHENELILSGQYAFSSPGDVKSKFAVNEGLIGQAAWEQKQISIDDLSDSGICITSSVLNVKPRHLLITPYLFEGKTMGVIEIGRLTDFNDTEKEFIDASMDIIAISVNSAIARKQIQELLEETQHQNDEKEKRAQELGVANKELAFQNEEKEKRAQELGVANKELAFQNDEKEKRAEELGIANKELAFQNDEKEKRAEELGIANRELAFQNDEKEKRAAELDIANKELAYQNDEKEKRAAELVIANKELAFQNNEKEKRALELSFANNELSDQAEELQTQQEELKQMNEELEEQALNLKQQKEELQMTNEELEEQTQSLEIKNIEVLTAKNDIEQKTKQLEISSKYKSEFLANMSHELRTPLNSLLILSKDLSENRNKNLDSIQIESAEIIYKSGHDLLVLINEVLDLSKIEAGKMTLNIENVSLKKFSNDLIREFKHHAEQKGLTLSLKLDNELPESIRTDPQRLNQILKNLLSNAIKFTEKGSVNIRISPGSENKVVISVADSGIGISEDKQISVFEAFQQVEGGTSRKYGGTGLGLSISRELAKLLGAEIKLSSKLNKGSVFSLTIPLEILAQQEQLSIEIIKRSALPDIKSSNYNKYLDYPSISDDRNEITGNDKIVLIIEDDLRFASILLKHANKKGFKCLSASSGEDGLLLASKYKPQAIILDMSLPGINGNSVLSELKSNPSVRHIPVHIISAKERSLESIKEGALGYLMKPVNKKDLDDAFNRIVNFVDRKTKNLLIIEDSEDSRKAMRLLIGNGDVSCFDAGTGREGLSLYKQNHIDCIILDIGLPDMSGFEFIRKLKNVKDHNIPPIIVYTGKELTKEENNELQKYAKSIIIKGVRSEERLLDETSLFLHRTISNLPKSKQLIINNLYDKESVFHGKKILVADDDMRNLFALSKVLKERGMEIIKAENGKIALELLASNPDIHLVLMDIMMPEMDGYEAMKAIRAQVQFLKLPVIALTAKAMKDDKQKCIDAGANDYITKPIDIERLLSLMRVWLSQ
jgi:signal transduction histidine kinase/CheY-like chemotaxis protein/CHASE3 domain sensor protein